MSFCIEAFNAQSQFLHVLLEYFNSYGIYNIAWIFSSHTILHEYFPLVEMKGILRIVYTKQDLTLVNEKQSLSLSHLHFCFANINVL